MRILSMEVDHGPFRRVLTLPDHARVGRAESEYREGLLWVRIPLDEPG
jgi:HSP20 family molecular chaperone IbpA